PVELRKNTVTENATTGEVLGYPAVEYYPGVADPALAVSARLAAGMDLRGYDVRLHRVPLVSLSGRVMVAPGEPLDGGHVELQTRGAVGPAVDETLGMRPLGADGSFTFDMIHPNAYVVMVYRGRNGTGLPYVAPVEVGKAGLRDREIIVPPWQTV